jgi:hypothetical protein
VYVRTRILFGLCFALLASLGTICSTSAATSRDGRTLTQTALTFVNNVSGIDVDMYNVTSDCKGPIDSPLYPGHTEALIDLSLTSPDSQIEMELEFIDSWLVSYRLTSESGQLALNAAKSSDVLNAAKDALGRYQKLFNIVYVSQLALMIDSITTEDRAQTFDLEFATISFHPDASMAGSASITWSCKNATRKILALSINKEGLLEWFRDMWGINKISNSEILISAQTALQVASDNVKDYAKKLGARIANVNITFGYINSYPEARGGDPFVLYPSWDVEFTFDRLYDNAISGYFVGIWADTGEMRTATPEGFWGQLPQPPDSSIGPLPWLVVAAVAIFVLGGAFVLTLQKKRTRKKAR